MKSRIEDGDMRDAGKQFAGDTNRADRGWVVQRRQVLEFSSLASTSPSMSVGAVKRSPPCTTRWTTASILPSSIQRLRSSASTASMAAVIARLAASVRRVSPTMSCGFVVADIFDAQLEGPRPGRFPITAHLIDELPQLIARMRTGLPRTFHGLPE